MMFQQTDIIFSKKHWYNNMRKTEVTKSLNEKFKPILSKYGFKKWKFGFIKEDKEFYHVFAYSSSAYDTCFPTTFYYGIGLQKVKNILKKIFLENLSRAENQYPAILSYGQKELFEAKKYPIFKYDIYNESDVNNMVTNVSRYFIEEALPYLQSISNIEKLEEIINTEPKPRKKDVGLILARLGNNPNYEHLKQQYRELLEDWSDWDKKELEKVISYLDSHSLEELKTISETPDALKKH